MSVRVQSVANHVRHCHDAVEDVNLLLLVAVDDDGADLDRQHHAVLAARQERPSPTERWRRQTAKRRSFKVAREFCAKDAC